MAKFCKDCKHCLTANDAADSKCALSDNVDIVTGNKSPWFCHTMRVWGACGEEGKLFEPKEEKIIAFSTGNGACQVRQA